MDERRTAFFRSSFFVHSFELPELESIIQDTGAENFEASEKARVWKQKRKDEC